MGLLRRMAKKAEKTMEEKLARAEAAEAAEAAELDIARAQAEAEAEETKKDEIASASEPEKAPAPAPEPEPDPAPAPAPEPELKLGIEYRARNPKGGRLVSFGTEEEAKGFSSDWFEAYFWRNGDGDAVDLTKEELVNLFSKSPYTGIRRAYLVKGKEMEKPIPADNMFAAVQIADFEPALLISRLAEYDEKGEFVKFADITPPEKKPKPEKKPESEKAKSNTAGKKSAKK